MYRQLPNSLTILRLLLALVFFFILGLYRFPDGPQWALFAAMGLFIAAAITDGLDGYLARKWKVESTFGRIMDPFCDKVLVIGAFIFLAGPRFVERTGPFVGGFKIVPENMVSGVYPWMVAIMLARELLVTGMRGELEGYGKEFPAQLSGKLKMILQSSCVPLVLFMVWLNPRRSGHEWLEWARDILVYATVLTTLVSGIPYVASAAAVLKRDPRPRP